MLWRGNDIDHRLHRIVRNDGRGIFAGDGCQPAQYLRTLSAISRNRNVLKIRQGLIAVFRSLRNDRIRHAVAFIQPERGRDLETAGHRHHQAICNIALGNSKFFRTGAIDIDQQFRIVVGLLNANVGNSRHFVDLAQQFFRVSHIRFAARPHDLQIDGGGCAKVQDLTDDISWQKRKSRLQET